MGATKIADLAFPFFIHQSLITIIEAEILFLQENKNSEINKIDIVSKFFVYSLINFE